MRALNYTLEPIDSGGDKIRSTVITRGVELLEREKIVIPQYTDDDLVNFALEWKDLSGVDTKSARRVLAQCVEVDCTALEWVCRNYSLDRLFCLYEFSVYCEWLDVVEIIQHFGDFLRVFIALEGSKPSWCTVTFHLLLKVAYVELWRLYRTHVICEWLEDHWDEAVDHFERNIGNLASLPKIRDLEYSHVYTQYNRMRKKVKSKEM